MVPVLHQLSSLTVTRSVKKDRGSGGSGQGACRDYRRERVQSSDLTPPQTSPYKGPYREPGESRMWVPRLFSLGVLGDRGRDDRSHGWGEKGSRER